MNAQGCNCVTNSTFICNNKSANNHPLKKNDQSNPGVEELRNAINFVQLANQGNIDAQRIIGLMYLNGQGGVKQNLTVALFWLLQAAKQECAEAQYKVGEIYSTNNKFDNYRNAFIWTRSAAILGHVEARSRLKQLRTFTLYKLDHPSHQTYLNVLLNTEKRYQEQVGFPINRGKTVEELEQSTEQESGETEYRLGLLYLHGEGINEDNVKAFTYFKNAAANGHPEAQSILDRMVDKIFECDKVVSKTKGNK